MDIEEVMNTIDIAIAEVEWNYPLDYAIAFSEAIKYLKELKALREKINN